MRTDLAFPAKYNPDEPLAAIAGEPAEALKALTDYYLMPTRSLTDLARKYRDEAKEIGSAPFAKISEISQWNLFYLWPERVKAQTDIDNRRKLAVISERREKVLEMEWDLTQTLKRLLLKAIDGLQQQLDDDTADLKINQVAQLATTVSNLARRGANLPSQITHNDSEITINAYAHSDWREDFDELPIEQKMEYINKLAQSILSAQQLADGETIEAEFKNEEIEDEPNAR